MASPDAPTNDEQPLEAWQRKQPPVCAECKRLKLRCDRKVPCVSCVRRHCENLCPNGTNARGRAYQSRLVLADSAELHARIDEMRSRTLELENAIASYRVASVPGVHGGGQESAGDSGSDRELHELFGTLTLGDVSNFIGPNAASDFLLFRKKPRDAVGRGRCYLPDILSPFVALQSPTRVPVQQQDLSAMLVALPPKEIAYALVDGYFDTVAWIFGTVSHEQVRSSILDILYMGRLSAERPVSLNGLGLHDLALLFVVLGIAYVLQPGEEPSMFEARRCTALCSICLTTDSFMAHVTLQGVRALHLLTWIMHLADDPHTVTTAYNLLGLNANLCRTLGLHRDDGVWSLDENEKQMRRSLVWDIVLYDGAVSEALGRPSAWSLAHFDARLPADEKATFDDGEWQHSYTTWSHSFASSCLLRVMDRAFGAARVSHGTVMQLDLIVREHPVSPALRMPSAPEADIPLRLALQRATALILPQKLLMYLHRGFYARAMGEDAADPLASAFRASVLACFRAALYITSTMRALAQDAQAGTFCARLPSLWSAAFSASVVLGSIVIRSPACALAQGAWVEFDAMYAVFERVAPHSRTVTRVMPNLRMLHQKARASWAQRPETPAPADLDELEMAFIYGRTLVAQTDAEPYQALLEDDYGGPLIGRHVLVSSSRAASQGVEPAPASGHLGGDVSANSLFGGEHVQDQEMHEVQNLDAAWANFMKDIGISGAMEAEHSCSL